MANPRAVIGALSGIEALLDRLSYDIEHSMRSAETYITGTQHAIDRCRAELEHNLYRAQSDLLACQRSGYTDKDGRYVQPNCDREEAIVGAVQEKIYQLRVFADVFEYDVLEYRSRAARMRSLLSGTIPSAKAFVRERREALERFEASGGSGALALTFGATVFGTAAVVRKATRHGYDYQKARQQYLRMLADDPNQPSFVRGWVKQEINRIEAQHNAMGRGLQPPGGSHNRLRGVPGFDIGHRIPDVHLPSNFRLENASGNRARPGIARRLGLSERYR